MKWLRNLLQRIEALSEKDVASQEPETEVGDSEKVIDVVPKGLRKLFAYRGILIDKCNAMKKAHDKEHRSPNHTQEMCEKFGASMSPLDDEIEVTGKAFWSELRDELKIKSSCIGIREGWKVVEMTEEEETRIRVISMGIGSVDDLLHALM